jgi:hypothetical protein
MSYYGYDDYVAEIKQDISELADIQQVLGYLDRKQQQLRDAKFETEKILEAIVTRTENKIFDIEVFEAVKILKRFAIQAIAQTKEFNIGEYRLALIAAIEDPRTIRMYYDSKYDEVKVQIRLNITAGNLHDYARSINKTRRELVMGSRGKRPLASAALASLMWREKYYKPAREGTEIPQPVKKTRTSKRKERSDKKEKREYNTEQYVAKYKETMRRRLENFGADSPAPFWQIVDQGTTSLDSDYGGEAYPIIAPTRFVEKARKAILGLVGRTIKTSNEDIKQVREQLIRINKAIQYVDKLLPNVIAKIERIALRATRVNKQVDTISKSVFTLTQVKQALGERFSNTDMRKLLDLVNGLVQGTVDPNKRVSLTKAGSNQVVRMRLKNLTKIVQEHGRD